MVVTVICITLILHGILCLLVPDGSMKKSFTSAVTISMIASVVLSLKGLNFKFNDVFLYNSTDFNTEEISEELLNLEESVVKQSVENLLYEKIKAITDEDFSINVITDISSDGDISINGVIIRCHEQDIQNISNAVESLGLNAQFSESEG